MMRNKRTALMLLLCFLLCGCVTDGAGRSAGFSDNQFPATIVYLVRHAEKTEGNAPALTPVGKARALALAAILKKEPIDLLLSSDYRRTKATVRPLAEQKNLEIQIYDASDSEALVQRIHLMKGKSIVVAGHSNTIPEIVDLLDPQAMPRPDLAHNEYDKIFIVAIYSSNQAVTLELSYPELNQQ